MKFTEVENLLSERLGFDVQTVGPQAIDSGIRQSMEEAGFSDPAAYARMLVGDPDAWNQLIDRVVIPETWFFRDIAPFEMAASLAREHVRRASGNVMRILSVPCSTGEEPYSLVMGMLHAGAQPETFTVDAVDMSRRNLETARVAEFRVRSFRENALWFRTLYFDHAEGTGLWRLHDSVASLVRFRHSNLIAPDFLEDEPPYDMVFCRNLLIYLHTQARQAAITALRRLVAHNGVLVLGHAEAAFARENGFTPTGPAASFAFNNPAARVTPKPAPVSRQNIPARAPRPAAQVTRPAPTVPLATTTPANGAAVSTQEPEASLLVIARNLGDSGKLHEALRVCGEYLQRVPDSAEAYFLQGVLHDALGDGELAAASFRKVLYLNPAHREALLHLALKHEARGDAPGAALLRARARRAEHLSTKE